MNRHDLKKLLDAATAGRVSVQPTYPNKKDEARAVMSYAIMPDLQGDPEIARFYGKNCVANNKAHAALRNCAPRLLALLDECAHQIRHTSNQNCGEILARIDGPLDEE